MTGRSARDVPAANEAMGRVVRNAGRPGLVAGALSAADIGRWGLKARLLGFPSCDYTERAAMTCPSSQRRNRTYEDAQQDRQRRT